MEKDHLGEIENLAASIDIVGAVIAYEFQLKGENDNTKKMSVAEKYKDFDFVGAAGKKVLEALQKGKQKAINFLGKSKEFINNDIYQTLVRAEVRKEKSEKRQKAVKEFIKNDVENTIARQKARQEAVHGFIDKTEEKFNDMVFDTADKISDGIQRFNSKAEDLGNAIKAKYNSWKQKGKDKLANALENTKAFGRLVKDKAVEGYEHIGTMAGKAKEGMVNAAVTFGGAVVAAPGIAIKGVKKGARSVVLSGAKGLRNTLNKAADLAVRGANALEGKINTPEKETQNKDGDAR